MNNSEVIANFREKLQEELNKNGWKFKFHPPKLGTQCVTYIKAEDVGAMGVDQISCKLLDCNRELNPNDSNQLKSIDELLEYALPRLKRYAALCGLSENEVSKPAIITIDPVKDLVVKYKEHLVKNGLAEESYKWELLEQFKGHPDITASDFYEEVKSVKYANLIYPVGIGVIHQIAKERPEQYRNYFTTLFDEKLPLADRINAFSLGINNLYRELEPDLKKSHHHDERTIATMLSFYNPFKYALYKDSFYQKYCKLIGIKAKKKGEKYLHYLELLGEFISDYLEPDTELLDLVSNLLPKDAFKDTHYKILAQDILYRMLDKGLEEIEIGNASVYKISMGWFKDHEIDDCINLSKILVHEDTDPIGQMKESQGYIFKTRMLVGDYFYLTPGNRKSGASLLGKIISDAVPTSYSDYGSKGWLERSFEVVSLPKNKTRYTGKQKWWTPNSRTTCYAIDSNLIEEANKLLFEPYFMTKLIQTTLDAADTEHFEEIAANESQSVKTGIPLNVIFYGPPGTGKTYNTITTALEILGLNTNNKSRNDLKSLFDKRVESGQIVFTTFHQSMSYEDFIEGIKPLEPSSDGNPVVYKVVDGIFKKLCRISAPFQIGEKIGSHEVISVSSEVLILGKPKGGQVPFTFKLLYKLLEYLEEKGISLDNSDANIALDEVEKVQYPELELHIVNGYRYILKHVIAKLKSHKPDLNEIVLIIDEINRGNVSQIFGELITLIEEDKRLGKDEQLVVTLPYSKEKFGVPANLYIIGTMNTADRSVEALDTALRRRFSFVEMPPRYDLVELQKEVEGYKLTDILRKINRRIEKLLGKDNLIGHSYFLCVKNSNDLRAAFQNKIIPLLQEYFYGDYGKIGLVLGEGFFETIEDNGDDIFATFGNYDASGLAEKEVYHLAELIGENRLADKAFKTALDKMMK